MAALDRINLRSDPNERAALRQGVASYRPARSRVARDVPLSVATKFEGMRIKKTEGRVGSEEPVVLVGFAHDGVEDAAIDAQSAA
jgi:hypothetical protein